MPFVKLDCGIIHSSLWAEDSDTKICWITMLLLADASGFVRAAASAISREAGISAEAGRKAIALFESPDDESRSPENQGKRVEKVEGGYRVLNYEKYREFDYTNSERQKRHRQKLRNIVTPLRNTVTPVTRNGVSRMQKQSTEAEADKKEEGANESRPTFDLEKWLDELEKDTAYASIRIRVEFGKCRQWCLINKKQLSKRRFVNWINRVEVPISSEPKVKPNYRIAPPRPTREPTEEEFVKSRAIVAREMEDFRKRWKHSLKIKGENQ